ncbi:glycosyltransferase family 4 protein [Butyrivibrio hungatei]|uniref:glycosyltransferase family 4 protein n=1 Tax=Butyrivibrio hungatei TaxID=185008 RepID=UPI00041DD0D7|nr:glycosyltransferase family 4 protein [Butyrivibrio hungatei]
MGVNIDSILFVSHEFGVGGATRSLISLIKGINYIFPEIQCQVLVPLKHGKKNKACDLFEQNGVRYKNMLYRNDYKKVTDGYSFKYFIYDLINQFAVNKIGKYISKEHFSLICSNSTAVSVGGAAAINKRIPHIQYIREMMEEDFQIEYRDKGLIKDIIEKSDGVVFNSGFVREKYIALYDIQSEVMFHVGINVQEFYYEKHDLFKKKNINIIQIGTFKDGKGTKNSIEIMKRLRDHGADNFVMTFVGGGDNKYIDEMKSLITKYELEQNIKIVDYTNCINQYLNDADIFIMNSFSEGFGRVTVEAMAAGCLVLARNAGGTKEIVTDGNTGLLFNNEDEAADKIVEVLAEKEKYIEVALRGQKYAMDNYGEIKTAKLFMDFCMSQLKNVNSSLE